MHHAITKYGPAYAVKMDPVVFEKRERALERGYAKLIAGREHLMHASDRQRQLHAVADTASVYRLRAQRELIAQRHTVFKAREAVLNVRARQMEVRKINGMLARVEMLRRSMEHQGADRASVEKLSHIRQRLQLRKARVWAH